MAVAGTPLAIRQPRSFSVYSLVIVSTPHKSFHMTCRGRDWDRISNRTKTTSPYPTIYTYFIYIYIHMQEYTVISTDLVVEGESRDEKKCQQWIVPGTFDAVGVKMKIKKTSPSSPPHPFFTRNPWEIVRFSPIVVPVSFVRIDDIFLLWHTRRFWRKFKRISIFTSNHALKIAPSCKYVCDTYHKWIGGDGENRFEVSKYP